ncbi:MAG: S41 family peptidase [Armatimonadetes bacterium ATM1]|nr:MAG: S41 family peptidase [Armatimonadota bacterium]MBC6968609.1 S41 family peptidase [Armatimonadota bacterium]MCE7898552.1 S41 family peptidase [Armatimonadetes bacterium ATM1]RIJ98280.1 MAG: hypothetical protein DCC45_00480 [Armatimonadota bacterium]
MLARVVFFAGLLGLFSMGLMVGYGWRDAVAGRLPQYATIPDALGLKTQQADLDPTRAFSRAIRAIDNGFYGKPDRERLTFAAVQGMLGALRDPYTVLMPPQEAERFDERNRGVFIGSGGIGAELSKDPLGARVRRVFKNSPAATAGVKTEDVILKVNGVNIAGEDIEEIVKLIRGEPGSEVSLTMFREKTKETKTFRVVRAIVHIQDVYSEVITGVAGLDSEKVGRLEVRSFSETIVEQFDEELSALQEAGISGLIIDLRGNPGGLLRAAVEMAARFLDDRLIVSIRDRNGRSDDFYSPSGFALDHSYPIVLLIDENTASAAEIFAGAMRDYNAATLVGAHTYGKAVVQDVVDMPGGAQVKITVARYYLPSGASIQRVEDQDGNYVSGGIAPDITVEYKDGDTVVFGNPEKDPQLRRAVEHIVSQIRT